MSGAAERDQGKLHDLLSGLHAQLLAARSVKPEDYMLLRQLADDIQTALDRGMTRAAAGHLPERLRNAVSVFEASHPKLSRALANAIDALALYNL